MKALTILAAASVPALSAGAASAEGWTSINDRQVTLDARIDAGVRNGDLTVRKPWASEATSAPWKI